MPGRARPSTVRAMSRASPHEGDPGQTADVRSADLEFGAGYVESPQPLHRERWGEGPSGAAESLGEAAPESDEGWGQVADGPSEAWGEGPTGAIDAFGDGLAALVGHFFPVAPDGGTDPAPEPPPGDGEDAAAGG